MVQNVEPSQNTFRAFSIAVVGIPHTRVGEFVERLSVVTKATHVTSNGQPWQTYQLYLRDQQCFVRIYMVNESDILHVTDRPVHLRVTPDSDGLILCYDVANRASFLDMLDLLAAENQTPTALVGWQMDYKEMREVESALGAKLAGVFNVHYSEVRWDLVEAGAGLMMIIRSLVIQIVKKKDAAQPEVPDPSTDPKYTMLRTQLKKLRESTGSLRPPSLLASQQRELHRASQASVQELGLYPMPHLRTPSEMAEEQRELNLSADRATPSPHPSVSAHSQDAAQTSAARTESPHPSTAGTERGANTDNRPRLPSVDTDVRRRSRRTDISEISSEDTMPDDPFLQSYDSFASKNWKHLSSNADDSTLSVISGSSGTGRLGFALDELIERLTSPHAHDMEFVKVFLMLYRKFMRPSELLDRLMDRFDAMEDKDDETQARGGPINAVQLRVCNVLIHWCNDYWCDFHSDIMRFTMHVFLEICSSRPAYAAICQKLGSLVFREPPSDAERELSDWGLTDVMDVARSPSVSSPHSGYDDSTLEEHARSVHQRLSGSKSSEDFGGKRSGYGDAENASARSFDRRSANSNTTSMSSHSDGTEHGSIYGSNLTAAGVSFLELDNEDIAKQLNILEAEIFSRIKPRDLLQHIWSRTHKGRHAASVAASIGHFNFISSWVTTRILAQRKVKTRAQVLGKFMKIAQVLRNSNNYNTLMAVLAGINSGAILRLRQTRKFLQDRQSYRNHQALEKLMSSDKSFALYRQALRQSELPCIPYLGVFLRDLVYIDENKDKRPDGSINLPKFLLMGDVILMIQNFQQVPYDVVRNPYIATLILSQPVMSEEQSYERSLELEPRTASTSPHR